MAQATSEIPVTLRLTKSAEARLAGHAAAAGKPLSEYIAGLVEIVAEEPRSIEQISGPVYQRFLESGVSDDQLADELEQAKHEMREQRRNRRPA